MSTSDRLGGLRTPVLPFVIQRLAETSTAGNTADLNLRAKERFDQTVDAARTFHREHPEEDADVHMAHLMQLFTDVGIPALASLPIIDELVLK